MGGDVCDQFGAVDCSGGEAVCSGVRGGEWDGAEDAVDAWWGA